MLYIPLSHFISNGYCAFTYEMSHFLSNLFVEVDTVCTFFLFRYHMNKYLML